MKHVNLIIAVGDETDTQSYKFSGNREYLVIKLWWWWGG